MNRILTILALVTLFFSYANAQPELLLTSERSLKLKDVAAVARDLYTVRVSDEALQKVRAGHAIVMQAAANGMDVYGLTVGVGWNKDQPVFIEKNGEKILSEELLALSRNFNRSSLRAHAASMGEPMTVEEVRAGMLIRLNTFLNGEAGVSEEVVHAYVAFLNHGITPVIPMIGTVGEADITLASHIGLAMIGEWRVMYKGRIQPSSAVMQALNIMPLVPVGKDFLSILSTNSLMAGKAVLTTLDIEAYYQKQMALFAFMLEAYNGNVAPFLKPVIMARPFKGLENTATDLRVRLKGSDLWNPSNNRALQDPLSFRTMIYVLTTVRNNLDQLIDALLIQINHSDDNPIVILGMPDLYDNQSASYYVSGKVSGAIIPTANFNFLPVVTRIEYLNQSLAKLAEIKVQQLIRMESPDFTRLTRFLSYPSNHGHAFGAIQKPFVELSIRIKHLAQPLSFQSGTLAGNIEDTLLMSGYIIENSQKILDGLYNIAAFQLLHGAQAIDLRADFQLSSTSQKIMDAYRKQIPVIKEDQPYSDLLNQSKQFWQTIILSLEVL